MKCTDFNGVEYNSIIEMCEHYNVAPRVYRYRISKGMTQKEALCDNNYIFDNYGNKFTSLTQFCNYYKVSPNTVNSYKSVGCDERQISSIILYMRGMLSDDEIKEIVDFSLIKFTSGRHIVFENREYITVKDLCRAYNVKYYTYLKRQWKGWPIEWCVKGKPKKGRTVICPRGVTYNKVFYKSYKELCEAFNVNYNTFMCRKSKGKSLEECLK